jgi:ribonuclease Z
MAGPVFAQGSKPSQKTGGQTVASFRAQYAAMMANFSRIYAATGDTAAAKSVVEASEGADLLVHEATFLADERDRARETAHSTAGEAALVAREAGVKLLALTHVSTRYFGHEVVEEASQLFPATVVPRDFDLVSVPFAERGEPELVRSGARTRKAPLGSVES